MNLPICLRDRVDTEQAVLATLLDRLRVPTAQALAIDTAINHHVRNVDAVRAVFTRHALRDHSQAGLCRREMRIAWFAAEAGRSSREDERATAERNKSPRGLASDQEAAEASDAPKILEPVGREFAK